MNMRTKKIVCASFISLLVVLLPHEQKNMKGNMFHKNDFGCKYNDYYGIIAIFAP